MFDDLPIRFENPILLLLLLLVIPTWFIGRMGSDGQSAGKFWTSFTVRSLLIALLSVALARPSVVEQGESVTLMVVADVSRSIPRTLQRQSQDFLKQIEEAKTQIEDRIGVVSVARDAEIKETPNANARIELGAEGGGELWHQLFGEG